MNKRRDALRRGVRALIRDASRELAVLEGRPLPAEPDGAGSRAQPPRAPSAAPAAADGGAAAEPRAPGSLWPDGLPVDGTPARPARPGAPQDPSPRASVPSTDAEREAPPRTPAPPTIAAPHLTPSAGFDQEVMEAQARQVHSVIDAPRPVRPAPPEPRLEPVPPPGVGPVFVEGHPVKTPRPPQIEDSPEVASQSKVEYPLKVEYPPKTVFPPKAAPAPKATRATKGGRTVKAARASKTARPAKAALSSQAARAVRKSASLTALRKARRSRHRLLPDIPVDGADPHQAFSRTGVCFAYFVNNACWRVRDAYCNTALHMCIIRNCPVYHLHKETLERRFARKFEHLW